MNEQNGIESLEPRAAHAARAIDCEIINSGSATRGTQKHVAQKHVAKGSSDARRLLDPGDILSATNGASIEQKWDWFSNRLNRAGFQSCGFLISRNDIESPLGHKDSHLMGEVVSKDYLKAALEKPELQSQARPYRMLRTSREPITFLSDKDFAYATPSEEKLAKHVNAEFGIEGWALFPVHMPEKNRMCGLGWWDMTDQEQARRLWKEEAGTFCLAATYFAESLSGIFQASIKEDFPQLSQREKECLLWAGAGKTTGEIAAILNVADGTVDEYFKRSAKKLGATTRAQACVKAVLSGLIHP